jgi:hypothetical protein
MTDTQEKVVYPVRLERAVYERLKRFAIREDLNTAQVVRRAIRHELERSAPRENQNTGK